MPIRLPLLTGLTALFSVLLAHGLVASLAPAAAQPADPDPQPKPEIREYVHDESQSCRIETMAMLEALPPCMRVTAIKWDSAFRQTGLRVGDRIVAVNGTTIDPPKELRELQRWLPTQVGNYAESRGWVAAQQGEGTPITLKVLRRVVPGEGWTELEFSAPLRSDRSWSIVENNRRIIGPGGPEGLYAKDGFDEGWQWWQDKFEKHVWRTLDDGFFNRRYQSRMELKTHLEFKARVDYLVAHYPGPFADAVKHDWDAAYEILQGRKYELSDEQLAFRQLGEQRADEIKQAGVDARKAWIEAHKADMIKPFPSIDPITGDVASVTGKFVELPDIGNREWVTEPGDVTWAVGTGDSRKDGYYFVNMHDKAARRMYDAVWRFKKLVMPRIESMRIGVIGRILGDPRMVSAGGNAVTGLELEPVAVTVDGKMFVDLTVETDGESHFAGEDALRMPGSAMPADDASPREVMEAYVAAIKASDETTFKALYASFRAVPVENGRLLWYPWYGYQLDRPYIRARQLIMEKICDARVLWVGDVRRISTGKEFEGAPLIDEVTVELEHIGQFDGEYRAFIGVETHRTWVLQRMNGGPWRITDGQDF
ncbi:MAG: hypothetical protein AB7K09_11000 [Planctomycetota bacterium]